MRRAQIQPIFVPIAAAALFTAYHFLFQVLDRPDIDEMRDFAMSKMSQLEQQELRAQVREDLAIEGWHRVEYLIHHDFFTQEQREAIYAYTSKNLMRPSRIYSFDDKTGSFELSRFLTSVAGVSLEQISKVPPNSLEMEIGYRSYQERFDVVLLSTCLDARTSKDARNGRCIPPDQNNLDDGPFAISFAKKVLRYMKWQ